MASPRQPTRGGGTKPEISSLVGNTVHENNDFLRNLICNSSHALDEIKVKLTQSAQLDPELFIRIIVDKAAKTLTIFDNGIGMTKFDLFRHLGAVAHSGFMKAPPPPNADLGLGLLSAAYLVADKVVITTKHDSHEQYRYVWAGGSFSIKPDAAGEQLGRGTKITLFLKENHIDYLAGRRIKDVVNRYKCSGCTTYRIFTDTVKDLEEKEEEAMHESMQISKRLRALEEISGKDFASLYKSMSKGLNDELRAVNHNKKKWMEALEVTENKDDNTELPGYKDSARLAGRTQSTSNSGGGDTRAVVEGQTGGGETMVPEANGGASAAEATTLPVPEQQPRNTRSSATEPGPGPGSSSFTPLFKRATAGRCYRCLSRDHFVASCTSPRRCLLCRGTDHIARDCALRHEYHGPGAPHRRLDWVAACAPFSDATMRAPAAGVSASPPAPAPLLLYKARVCIEGVPAHARQLATVAGLFAAGGGFALGESLDVADHGGGARGGREAECVCAWVWTSNPDTVAREGTLLIQEPRAPTWDSLVYSDRRLTGCPTSAAGPPRMLAYQVIIHLDQVYDYSPLPPPAAAASSTAGGGERGLLWPRCHVFSWRLGVLDGAAPPSPLC